MKLNEKKTKVMVVTKQARKSMPSADINEQHTKLENVEKFKYIRTISKWNTRDNSEVGILIALANKASTNRS